MNHLTAARFTIAALFILAALYLIVTTKPEPLPQREKTYAFWFSAEAGKRYWFTIGPDRIGVYNEDGSLLRADIINTDYR